MERFQRQRAEKKEEGDERREEEQGQGEESYRSQHRSWWVAGLKTDHLNAFRVNSKRDTLE